MRERASTPEPEPTPSPVSQSAVFEFSVRPTPTLVDIGAIPNFDRPRDPTPASRTEQLSRCLKYSLAPDPINQWRRLKVKVRNTCNNYVPADETWFEVVAAGPNGATIGRAVGHFGEPIAPFSWELETFIEVDCPLVGGCRYSVSVWSAAGGGHKVEQ